MRDILFRGKTIEKNKWYYGSYLFCHLPEYDWAGKPSAKEKDIHYIIDEKDINLSVYPETVGQYTNRKDKNGVRIFEGDIVSVFDGMKGYVAFSNRGFWAFIPLEPKEFFSNPEKLDDISLDLYCLIRDSEKGNYGGCLVVGNIYDNPELFNQESSAI